MNVILKASEDAIDEDLILTDRESYISEPITSEVLDESVAVIDDNLYSLRLKVYGLAMYMDIDLKLSTIRLDGNIFSKNPGENVVHSARPKRFHY